MPWRCCLLSKRRENCHGSVVCLSALLHSCLPSPQPYLLQPLKDTKNVEYAGTVRADSVVVGHCNMTGNVLMHISSRLVCLSLTYFPPLPTRPFIPLHSPGYAQRSTLLLRMSNLDQTECTESHATLMVEVEGYNYFVVDKDCSKGDKRSDGKYMAD